MIFAFDFLGSLYDANDQKREEKDAHAVEKGSNLPCTTAQQPITFTEGSFGEATEQQEIVTSLCELADNCS